MQINRVPQKKKKKKKKKVKRTSCRKPIRADQSPTAVPPISQSLDRKIRAESCRVALAFFFTRLFVVSPSFFFIRNIPITFCWLWVSLGWTGQRHVLSLMLLNLYLPSIMASYLPAFFWQFSVVSKTFLCVFLSWFDKVSLALSDRNNLFFRGFYLARADQLLLSFSSFRSTLFLCLFFYRVFLCISSEMFPSLFVGYGFHKVELVSAMFWVWCYWICIYRVLWLHIYQLFFGSFQSFPRLFCAFSFLGLTKFHWPYLIETIFFLEAFTWLVLTSFYWVFHRFGRPYFYVFFFTGFSCVFLQKCSHHFLLAMDFTRLNWSAPCFEFDVIGSVFTGSYGYCLSYLPILIEFWIVSGRVFFFLTSLLLMIVLLFNTRTGGSLAFGRPALGRLRPASIDQKKNQTNKRNKKTKEKETDGAEETTKTTTTIKKCN